ncbi:MAG: hypothetical protein L0229_22725 [Blastocatellia bacterium]|nr:hypothetical protein [Blastocatellia bacterium]
MFIRNVTMTLKADSAKEFTQLTESEIIPLLRKQNGFRDEITFVAADRSEAVAISLWDTKESAEAYDRTAYPEVLKIISKVVEGTPRAENFELSNSTFHKVAAKGA